MSNQNQPHAVFDRPFYFPLENGLYEVKPGLHKFPHDFGNGLADRQLFQFDHTYARYRAEKLAARAERLGKYYCHQGFEQAASSQICRFISHRMVEEQPDKFRLEQRGTALILHCLVSRDTLTFDAGYRLTDTKTESTVTPDYIDGLDALACQCHEDLAVVQVREDGLGQVTALHLCLPNHWAAEEKIGRSFLHVHKPVPGMSRMNLNVAQLTQAMIHKGPFVRFAWGIATDARLNHHPLPPAGIDLENWQGRAFNPAEPQLYLRVERQTIHGFPTVDSSLFTIRTYLYDIDSEVTGEYRARLVEAIESMPTDSAHYKGLDENRVEILCWLSS